ncbi:DUF192 domain-containing protein [Methanobrevibacter sp.]|uniref:DUF192 domain-containing protein n=1 Tax=Methanobrevibacter sp. TaxID=66852 RepID=UPI0025CFFF62|nr:DUF192 domain-containing protein [Methanobrevibacter sp.]MBQ2962371.1 DUF192 domain-containing protein [Methanobrevibacter sp.]
MRIISKNKESYKEKNLKTLCIKNSNEKIGKIRLANTFITRFRGLMLKEKCEYPLLFEIPQKIKIKERSSIHSLFMRFELTVVFIDEDDTVFEIADLKPWRYHVPKKSAKYIVEFEKNRFHRELRIGDEVEIR